MSNQDQTTNIKWSFEAWQAAEPVYKAILDHPFVKELSEGSLPTEKFAFYLNQDALYLEQYTSALAHIASRLDNRIQVDTFLNFAHDGIEVEKAMHEVFLDNISERTSQMSPTCLLYTSVIKSQRSMPLPVEVAAILPCFWIYLRVGQEIVARHSEVINNPYRMWIETYADTGFEESTRRAIEICDYLAEKTTTEIRKKMTEMFVLCSRMEWMFWDSAYKLEQWKV